MNTNDEQANYTGILPFVKPRTEVDPEPYTPKAEQRAPLKSNEELFAVWKRIAEMPGHFILEAVHQELHLLRDFYENLITSGELRVVETVHDDEDGACTNCGHLFYVDDSGPKNFCPGCGAKIIE